MNTNINNLNKKINSIKKKKEKEIFVIKPEVNLCVSALG